MMETLTAVFVVLSLLALGIISLVVYLVFGGATPSGQCLSCGGSGRSVVHDRAGVMSTRCPVCKR